MTGSASTRRTLHAQEKGDIYIYICKQGGCLGEVWAQRALVARELADDKKGVQALDVAGR